MFGGLMGKAKSGLGTAWGAAKGFAGSPTGIGAAIGAGIGGYQGIDNGAGGFFGGAAMGAMGGGAFSRWGAGKNLMSRGLGAATMGVGSAAIKSDYKFAIDGAVGFGNKVAGIIPFTNRHGDKILMGLGSASAGYIGSSALSSNRAY